MKNPEQETHDVIEQVIRLTQGYAIWWQIVSRENAARFPETRNRDVDLFEPLHFLLAESLVVSLYRLFDRRPDSSHILSLIAEVEKKDLALASRVKAQLDLHRPTIDKITTIRHKVVAHRDKQKAALDVFEDTALIVKELKNIIELVQDIVATLAEALNIEKKHDVMREFASFEERSRTGTFRALTILAEKL